MTRFLVCPDCGKRSVWLKLGAEDWWRCRRCDWGAAAEPCSGYDYAVDRRERARLEEAQVFASDLEPLALYATQCDRGTAVRVRYRGREYIATVDRARGRVLDDVTVFTVQGGSRTLFGGITYETVRKAALAACSS
jgi:hypothetical protein